MKEPSSRLDAMQRALMEIRTLKRENEIHRARLDTLDLCAAMLFAQVRGNVMGAIHPNVEHLLERAIADEQTSPSPGGA